MTPRLAIYCLAIAQTVNWAGLFYIFAALLIRWQAIDDWSKPILTGAFAGAILMSAVIAPISGRLIDRGHGRRVLCVAAGMGAVFVALLPLTDSIWVFSALWLGIGACLGGCLYETCFAFVTRTRGDKARRDITLITLFAGFASTITFPLSHYVSEAAGWPSALWTLAAMVVLISLPLTWLATGYLEENSDPSAEKHRVFEPDDHRHAEPSRPLLRRPVFWLIAAGFALLGANHGVTVSHLLLILEDKNIARDVAVLAASCIGPMQVAGRIVMMAIERHVSSHAIATACFVAVLTATLSLYLSSVLPILLVTFVVFQGSGHGVTSIMRPVIVREVLGERNFGAKSGAVAVPFLILWALAPFIGAVIWEIGGYDLVLMTIAGFAVVGLISYRAATRLA